ncbi:hypothetical protein GDO78_002378 [Eleutherodactylus coqui]|uniref:Uncharacterized protein n=1 Tax=Eleutherodactylus coqui TaxID=57060 RepID=A0A8J6K2J5_ELECQ|nr:hypothetical protein GDO78_002378 [Eleutherodactylus coqui]
MFNSSPIFMGHLSQPVIILHLEMPEAVSSKVDSLLLYQQRVAHSYFISKGNAEHVTCYPHLSIAAKKKFLP